MDLQKIERFSQYCKVQGNVAAKDASTKLSVQVIMSSCPGGAGDQKQRNKNEHTVTGQ